MRARFVHLAIGILLISGFSPNKKIKPKLPAEFVRIPGGTDWDGNPDGPYNDPKDRKSIASFYMSKYEVSNWQYRQFISEIGMNLTAEETEMIGSDSSGWSRGPLAYGEPSRLFYYRHPAYKDYPVVNIRYEGAKKYCEWLQQKIQKVNPDFLIKVQLPSKAQWVWAAMAGHSDYNYPWGNGFLQDKKGGWRCNFKKVNNSAITRNRETGLPEVKKEWAGGGAQMPVKSFSPGEFGLYNMSGNVAEMIAQPGICMGGSWNDYGGDVTVKSQAAYKDFDPMTGFRPIIVITEKKKQEE